MNSGVVLDGLEEVAERGDVTLGHRRVVSGGDVAGGLSSVSEAGDDGADLVVGEEPSLGDGGEGADAVIAGELVEIEMGEGVGEFLSDGPEGVGVEVLSIGAIVTLVELGWVGGIELVEEDALVEGAEGDEGAVVRLHEGLESGVRADEVVVAEIGLVLEDVGLEDGDDAFEIVVGVGGLSDGEDLSLLHEVVHGLGGLVEEVVGLVVVVGSSEGAVVEVVEVDVVGLEVFERLLALVADVVWFVGTGGGAFEVADLGGEDVGVAFDAEFLQGLGEESFGLAVAIDVGVVPVVDPGVDAGLDALEDVVFVDVGPSDGLAVGDGPVWASHGPAAEADLGEFEGGSRDGAEFHGGTWWIVNAGCEMRCGSRDGGRLPPCALRLGGSGDGSAEFHAEGDGGESEDDVEYDVEGGEGVVMFLEEGEGFEAEGGEGGESAEDSGDEEESGVLVGRAGLARAAGPGGDEGSDEEASEEVDDKGGEGESVAEEFEGGESDEVSRDSAGAAAEADEDGGEHV